MENALIPVFTVAIAEENAQFCNARNLHACLQVGRDFSNWIKDRIEQYGFIEGEDYSPNLARIPGKRGQPRMDYHLTLDMAKELAMIENNAVGRKVRRYFIQAEKELRKRLIAELEDKARHVLPLPGIKPFRSGITFKMTVILQKQSRDLMHLILDEQAAPARINLHRQLRQVNDALGIPTDSLAEIVGITPALEA